MKFNFKKAFVVFCLITITCVARLLTPVPNFNPVTAVVLFFGTIFPFMIGVVIMMGTMIITDVFVYGFSISISPFVYLSLFLVLLIGRSNKDRPFIGTILSICASSLLFFFITNTASWY